VKRLGLDGMELEFVQGVWMKEAMARDVAKLASDENLALTVHAPYYINFHAKEKEKREQSAGRLLLAARMGRMAGAKSIAFHGGFYLKDTAENTYQSMEEGVARVRKQLDEEGNGATLAPELTGKPTQWGDLTEILRLSKNVGGLARRGGVAPCIDFAHYHARTNGKQNTYKEFMAALDAVEKTLGKGALSRLHVHVAGIRYSAKGELNHLPLEKSDMNWRDLLRAFKAKGVGGWVVCESPLQEDDALLLKRTYEELS
jgi:deoxyribonuclease IV